MVARLVATSRKGGKSSRANAPERISPKHAATLVTRAVDQMTEVQQRPFDRISAQCPDVIELRQMALAFRAALTGGDAAKLRLWIEGARRCEYGPVVRFAYGLRKDLLAVSAAVEASWRISQVEGQINRLKMIKRQMYGRAGFRLLRARVLPYMPAICVGAGSMTAPKLRKSPELTRPCLPKMTRSSQPKARSGRPFQMNRSR